ncbi:hypothetical protein R3P38DRAFT_2794942 [Favolaschia claudopus]|uniref:Maturase K n=1 Tax=Favolaschia claudopus TaxID=2862362 RepID=A0AAW0A987_9AGAR
MPIRFWILYSSGLPWKTCSFPIDHASPHALIAVNSLERVNHHVLEPSVDVQLLSQLKWPLIILNLDAIYVFYASKCVDMRHWSAKLYRWGIQSQKRIWFQNLDPELSHPMVSLNSHRRLSLWPKRYFLVEEW